MSRKELTPKQKQKIVDDWNDNHPVGTPVIVNRDSGEDFHTVTRSGADLLSGHTPVVWVKGLAGCYALTHVRAVAAQ